MSEVFKRDKRGDKILALDGVIRRDRTTATAAILAVWQKQLNDHWVEYVRLHEDVIDRTGDRLLDDEQQAYDVIEVAYYQVCVALEEIREALAPPPAAPIVAAAVQPEAGGQLQRRQTTLTMRLTNALGRVNEDMHQLPVGQLDALRDSIVQLYAQVQAVALERIENGAAVEQMMVAEAALDGLYMEALGALNTERERRNVVAPVVAPAPLMNGLQRDADALKLPQFHITPFDGSFEKWEAFRESFTHGIHNRANMAAVVKLQYLKSFLRGAPEELIQNVGLRDDNYAGAWQLLIDRYNNNQELVTSHLRVLTSFSQCRQNADDLRRLTNTTASTLLALRNLGRPVNEWSDWIVFHICEKIDKESRKLWRQQQSTREELPTWDELDRFLQSRVRALAADGEASTSCGGIRNQGKSNKVQAHATATSSQRNQAACIPNAQSAQTTHSGGCGFCRGSHLISFCADFKRLTVPDRRRMAAEKSLCFICLQTGHRAQQCTVNRVCQSCQQKHNTMLHDNIRTAATSDPTVQANTAVMSTTADLRQRPHVILATAIVNVKDAAGGIHQLRAFLDNGAEHSFVSECAAQLLQLPRQSENESLSAISGINAGRCTQSIWMQVSDRLGNGFVSTVNAFVLKRVTDDFKPVPPQETDGWPHIRDLALADPEFMMRRRIDLLLGSDIYWDCVLPDLCRYDGLPTAQNSYFGWLIGGTRRNANAADRAIQTHHVKVDTLLENFWELEETTSVRRFTVDEENCEAFYAATTTRDANGRMHVRLPLRYDDVNFGESQRFAVQRQIQIERRFAAHPDFAEQYRAFMETYLRLGHMKEVVGAHVDLSRSRLMQLSTGRDYYIPHHAVIKESSSTTKLRVVFDASRRTTNGVSLNDQLHIGPRLQDNLTAIMMRWRQHRVAYCADIEKMYRQILVDEPDSDLQRIVWRPSVNEPMKVFRLSTVTYGTAAAPYLAIKSMQTLAILERERHPIGARIVLNNFYVDDVLGGADSVSECITGQEQLIALLTSGGLSLRKWASNSDAVLAQVPPAHRETQLPLSIEDGSSISTLGVQWHPASDELGFNIDIAGESDAWTKRSFLSAASRLYDPLGWLAPCIIVVKMLFQSLWKCKLEWDDVLPTELAQEWETMRLALHALADVRISRWIGTSSGDNIELHGFCDASMSAYAAVVYVRVSGGEVTRIQNICAKTKVAPLKVVSLPRLELCGAVLLVKAINDVVAAMQWENVKIHCWSDSTIVLAWLRGHPSQYNVFVANRTAEIQRTLPAHHWQHVVSGDNPADCASRGMTPSQLLQHKLWWTGPEWLTQAPSCWPAQSDVWETREETRTRACPAVVRPRCWDLITKYSSWRKLVRMTALCTRFVHNYLCRKENRRIEPLTSTELIHAREFWVRTAQHMSFSAEIRALQHDGQICKSSPLRSFNPVYSTDRILRIGGRLANAHEMTAAARSPAIIPRRCELSALLISDAHEQTLHGGPALMLAYIRRAYWLIDGANEVRRYVSRCTTCFRYTAKPAQQLMAALPAARVVPSRPFKHCAMDYSGAILVRSAKGRGLHATKAYVAVFVCLATKAVHIELASDLTTTGFIAAYERFVARRGGCSDLYSDNATNFVGAARTFLQSERKLFDARVQSALATRGTKWHFSPPLSPHFNGLAESAIRSVKHHIRRVVGESTLTFEELTTVLSKIEACLNSRPISPLSSDPTSYDVLTPAHFLIGEPTVVISQADVSTAKISSLTRWQLTHQMVQRVWKRWSLEYLHTLQQRRKWQTTRDNIRVGDMVLVMEDNLPPAKWSMGRVSEAHPGDDGRVRVVTIRTKGTVFKRSVVKIAKLPLDDDDAEDTRTTSNYIV